MNSERISRAKIAFIFPAKYNLEGAISPTLNFGVRDDGRVAMSVGISFLELDPTQPYFVILHLYNPNGDNVVISSGMNAIPPDQIDSKKRTSFLTASFFFDVLELGTYRFKCELIDVVNSPKPSDSHEIYFNVTGADVING